MPPIIKPLLLDAGPLGKIAHPKRNTDIAAWLRRQLANGVQVIVPEITDYEVRWNLLLEGLLLSLSRLDGLKTTLTYLPLTTDVMQQAAQFWADSRKRGRPVGDPKELSGDTILAAQAISVGGIVVTDNVGHLSQFVEARTWKELN